MLACPADSTKRSRSGHLGLVGLCRRRRVHKTYAIGAAPNGIPGCPEFAFWTASIDSVRMVLMRRATIGCGRQAARCSGTNGAFRAVSAISADGADRFFWIWCRKRCNRSVCRARLATYLERRCCELAQHGYSRDSVATSRRLSLPDVRRRRLPGCSRGVRGQYRRSDDAVVTDRQAGAALQAKLVDWLKRVVRGDRGDRGVRILLCSSGESVANLTFGARSPHPTQMPGSVSGHPLDPLSTRRSRLKRRKPVSWRFFQNVDFFRSLLSCSISRFEARCFIPRLQRSASTRCALPETEPKTPVEQALMRGLDTA